MSSMNVCRSGTSVWSRASSRTSSSVGPTSKSAATAIQHLERIGHRQPAPREQYVEGVEHVGRLLAHSFIRLLAYRPRNLPRLLLHLLARERRVGEQAGGVALRRV